MSGKHGANSWDDYLSVHTSRLADFLGHFIVENHLAYARTLTQVYWDGVLDCVDGIEIHVHKLQAIEMHGGRPWVQTIDYSYQVLRQEGDRTVLLFRYDNSAHHAQPDPHHRHRYDVNGLEIVPPQHVGVDGWPTLGDVINEAFELWRRGREE
jgi:hypothetical protein